MVYMLAYDNEKEELKKLILTVRQLIAYYSGDKWNIEESSTLKELKQYFDKNPILDLACYDVSEKQSIDYLRHIREDYRNVFLMLLADYRMSPMEYIKPEILASELLIKPFSAEQLKDKLRDFLIAFTGKTNKDESEDLFVIETKDGITRVPFRQIYYFEAKEKRLSARTGTTVEHLFYGTLDELEKQLPKDFVRCHRGYIVNWNYVERIDLSASRLILSNDMDIVFSRTYKAKLKALR